MSTNTVKPALRSKRSKRVVENPDYVSFARRILRAYGRRVADGDIEALRALALLPSDVETVTRQAVRGLRVRLLLVRDRRPAGCVPAGGADAIRRPGRTRRPGSASPFGRPRNQCGDARDGDRRALPRHPAPGNLPGLRLPLPTGRGRGRLPQPGRGTPGALPPTPRRPAHSCG